MNKLVKNRTMINYIKSQRLGWFGHVYRMPDERMVKKVYEWKPMAIRSLGRLKNRWENDVKNDLSVMRIRNWKDCIQDRYKWKRIIEKAKTLNDWSCRAWRRRRRSKTVYLVTTKYNYLMKTKKTESKINKSISKVNNSSARQEIPYNLCNPQTISAFRAAHFWPLSESDKYSPHLPTYTLMIHLHNPHPHLGLSLSLFPSSFPAKTL